MVTVILPVHNGANYLASSIASVLAQDCDFTLHVLDDGSTDASPEIAQSTGDSRVRYSRNPAKFGLFKTLNRGFTEATTALVRIWAHDDVMLPGSLQRFVEFAEKHPAAGMVYCDFWAIDPMGSRTGKERQYEPQRERTPELADSDLSALLFYTFGCLPGNIHGPAAPPNVAGSGRIFGRHPAGPRL
jgi:glycosyltransferase involved in cell wall biosynthesis